MRNHFSIASVTVVRNAAGTLSRQLEALLRQTYPLEEMIVVDNGSTDSTVQLIRDHYPNITVIELGKNLGVGGAFAAGLSYAVLEKKRDWVWLLDDDSVPETEALERLITGYDFVEQGAQIGVVASIPSHGKSMTYPGLLWRQRLVPPRPDVTRKPVWFVDVTISSGTMIRREVVERVGMPRADFFMDFVDFEYCLRIRRHGYKVAMIRDSILHHTIGTPRIIGLFGFRRAWSDHVPWRQYYVMRNHTYTVWFLYPSTKSKLFLIGRLMRHGAAILLFSKQRLGSFSMMARGFLDGVSGKLGIRVVPETIAEPATSVGAPSYAAAPRNQ